MASYAHPEVLVSTDWVKERYRAPDAIRVIEINRDSRLYPADHIPGAVDWSMHFTDQARWAALDAQAFQTLMSQGGISNGATVVLYGDSDNALAAAGYWLFKRFGHEPVRLMNGGRKKWADEIDKVMTVDLPKIMAADYRVGMADDSLVATPDELAQAAKSGALAVVDVRRADEAAGAALGPPALAGMATGGSQLQVVHIPTSQAMAGSGAFKSADQLNKLYCVDHGLDSQRATITYCPSGAAACHAWFVLKYLLGFANVRCYVDRAM